jgi:hypothetical protein
MILGIRSLAHNAHSGKTIIRRICQKDGKKFKTLTELANIYCIVSTKFGVIKIFLKR